MSDGFREKILKFKGMLSGFDRLEKSVQVKLMEVADKLAPMVQGGGIAPKEIKVPEPIEYPDIKETIVPTVKKHILESFAESFVKSNWHPNFEKTQKNPSTSVPFSEKPSKDGPVHSENMSSHQQSLRDKKGVQKGDVKKDGAMGGPTLGSVIGFPGSPPTTTVNKASLMGVKPAKQTQVKVPKNPAEVQPPKKK
jgi:hypothetical protein